MRLLYLFSPICFLIFFTKFLILNLGKKKDKIYFRLFMVLWISVRNAFLTDLIKYSCICLLYLVLTFSFMGNDNNSMLYIFKKKIDIFSSTYFWSLNIAAYSRNNPNYGVLVWCYQYYTKISIYSWNNFELDILLGAVGSRRSNT